MGGEDVAPTFNAHAYTESRPSQAGNPPQSIMDHKVLDKVCIGLRVVRGPDWEWGDQDGGEGHVGTVVELDVARRAAVVQWDCTERCLYRCGHDSKYDLRVFDSGPTGA